MSKRAHYDFSKMTGTKNPYLKQLLIPWAIICAVCSTIVLSGGCMCVEMVSHIGTHETKLLPVSFWTNSCGDRVLECKVLDINLATSSGHDLGNRFLCATQTKWESAVRSVAGANYGGLDRTVYIQPIVNLANHATNGFWLTQSDVKRRMITLPPESCPPWLFVAGDRNQHISCPHYTTYLDSHQIEVIADVVVIESNQAIYRTRWQKPAQILLIPALIIDIATLPVQFLLIMHELSTIKG